MKRLIWKAGDTALGLIAGLIVFTPAIVFSVLAFMAVSAVCADSCGYPPFAAPQSCADPEWQCICAPNHTGNLRCSYVLVCSNGRR